MRRFTAPRERRTLLLVSSHVRNVLIVVVIAALVVLLPGGSSGAQVALQAVSLVFLASIGWFASLMYRQHRVELYSLGDRRRATLYASGTVAGVTLTATSRLWQTSGGSLVWLALVGGAAYGVLAVVWSARKY